MQLEWRDHPIQLVEQIRGLLRSETLADVTLSAEGRHLRAHGVILAAASQHFKELLCIDEMDRRPIIYLKDVRFEELRALIGFIYSGKAEVPAAGLNSFLKLADQLRVRGFEAESTNEERSPTKKPRVIRPKKSSTSPTKMSLNESLSASEPISIGDKVSNQENDLNSPFKKRRTNLVARSLDAMQNSENIIPGMIRRSQVKSLLYSSSSNGTSPPTSGLTPTKRNLSSNSSADRRTPLSPLNINYFWAATPSTSFAAESQEDYQKPEGEFEDQNVFKKPFTPPPLAASAIAKPLTPLPKPSHTSTVSCPLLEKEPPPYKDTRSKAPEQIQQNRSFDFSNPTSPSAANMTLDPNELAAKGATLLHHLALWMMEEKRHGGQKGEEEDSLNDTSQELPKRDHHDSGIQANKQDIPGLSVATSQVVPGLGSGQEAIVSGLGGGVVRRNLSVTSNVSQVQGGQSSSQQHTPTGGAISEADRPDSGFDSIKEDQQSKSGGLVETGNRLETTIDEKEEDEDQHQSEQSSPELNGGGILRQSRNRQPILRKRRLHQP